MSREDSGGAVGGGVGVFAHVRDEFLWDRGEIGDCVCKGVGTAEGKDDAWMGFGVVEGDVAAGIGKKRAGIPCLPGQCMSRMSPSQKW